jgi:plasmid stabilization system protein ParE
LIDAIAESLFSLGQYPQMGRRRDHDLRPGLRSFPTGEYVIIYHVQDADALILHVMRGSRDMEGLLGE